MVIFLLLLLPLMCIYSVCCVELLPRLPDIYWNSSNPIFRIDNTDHIIDVNRGNRFEYDQVNIICPTYSQDTPEDEAETYIIYNVSKEEYDSCRITASNPRKIAVCDNPHKIKYFTITFRSFTPQPGGLEFKPGQDYYFISTSSGRASGLHHKNGGRCSSHHMKVIFKVCCSNNKLGEHTDAKSDSRPLSFASVSDSTGELNKSFSPFFSLSNGKNGDNSKTSLLLEKIASNLSDHISTPSSIALPVWQDSGKVANVGHHHEEANRPSDQASSGSLNGVIDSNKLDVNSERNPYFTNLSGLLASRPSPSSSNSSFPATPLPVLPTSPTSYWWRPHFTKLPSLKHNYDLNNFRVIDGSLSDSGRSNSNTNKSSVSAWVIIVGSAVGVGIVCVVICALFACTNYLFFPPRRKQQLPKC